jgi:NAD(P)-dependent dehydrogenase (short-subunit alcohol dehydrogenase family)
MELDQKVAVVTGAASGIGLAIATQFAAEGASVVAGDWNADRLEQAIAGIRDVGGSIVPLQGDISDKAAAEALIDHALQEFGRIDVLCNNAGIMDHQQGVAALDDEIWRRVMGINVDGPMYTSRRAVQAMLTQGGGSIINVASIGAFRGGSAGAAYTASKHALLGLTRNTAWMYAREGVRCNAICPGATATNIGETMPQDKLDPAGLARTSSVYALIPATLTPDDVASLALFLASDAARMINGAVITADGGWSAG